MPLHIRNARASDRAALSNICLLTANSGSDGTALYSDPDYPGQVWALPYLEFASEHAFVLDDGEQVLGYILGTPDTLAFEARLATQWWPKLVKQYAGRRPEAELDGVVLGRIRHPVHADPMIATSHPAHLHVNLLPPAQSGGWGRKLIETQLASLRATGAPALHLGVSPSNDRAMGFYQHLGFKEIGRNTGIYLGMKL